MIFNRDCDKIRMLLASNIMKAYYLQLITLGKSNFLELSKMISQF